MTKNLGTMDRIIRLLVALAVGILWLTGAISGTLALILGIVAVVFLLTSLVSFCPLYFLLKLSTLRSTPQK